MSQDTPHHHGHRARLRDRLTRDAASLADYEILELVLGLAQTRRDTKPLAKDLLRMFGNMRGVMSARQEELLRVPGFSSGTLTLWVLVRELMTRYAESPVRERETIRSPRQIETMARLRLDGCSHEEIWAALLDQGNHLLAWIRLSEGTVNASSLHIRNLMEQVLAHKATGIILVHNHPGGSNRPSPADVSVTRDVYHAARIMSVTLLDHLVLGATECYSFKDDGLLG